MSSQMPGGTDGSRKRRRSMGAPARRSGGARRSSVGGGTYKKDRVHTFERWGNVFTVYDSGLDSITFENAPGWAITNDSADLGLGARQCGIAGQFSLSALPDYSEFTDLFDTYKIVKVELMITYLNNVAYGGKNARGAGTLPTLLHAPDYNDANNT